MINNIKNDVNNGINNNPYNNNKNLYSKDKGKSSDKIEKTEKSSLTETKYSNLTESEAAKLKNSQSEEVANFLKRIQEEIQKAEIIAIKIIKGEKLTTKELKFLGEKYPDLKKTAEQSKKDFIDLKGKLENCRTEQERQNLINNAIKEIKVMTQKGMISEIQSKIKMVAVEQAIKSTKKVIKEIKRAEFIATKIIKGEKLTVEQEAFIKKIYPDIKQIAEETAKECNELKQELKNCGTEKEKKNVLARVFNDLESKYQKGLLSKLEIKIKKAGIEEVIKESTNNNKEVQKAELVAVKMIRGEKITKAEIRFINDKYPDIKQLADKSIKDYISIKMDLKNCKTLDEKQKILLEVINDIEDKSKAGLICKEEVAIKILLIEKIKKEERKNNYKDENPKIIVNPYSYLSLGSFWGKLILAFVLIMAISIFFRII